MPKKTNLKSALNALNKQLEEFRKNRINAVLRPLHRERRKLEARIGEIDRIFERSLGHRTTTAKRPGTRARGGPRRRIRRSPEALKKIANGVVGFVKSAGKTGVIPAEIKKRFGQLIPTPAQFVKKHAGVELIRKGPSKRPTYFRP